MSKYPKAWYQAVQKAMVEDDRFPYWADALEVVFEALEKVGALKEPPKPFEAYYCKECAFHSYKAESVRHRYNDCPGHPVLMREVQDE